MHIDFCGKTAVVTASTGGIGRAIARGLAEAGASVVINGRSQASVDRALGELREEQPRATFLGAPADLSDAGGCAALVQAAPGADILVNNAGIFGPQDFFATEDAEWDRFLQTNLMSGVRLSRAYLPRMRDRGWGRVVFISSESALNIPPDMLHYGVTKTAQLGLSRGLAKSMANTGVTVNAVLPGPTLSDGFRAMFREEAEKQNRSIEDVGGDFVRAQRPSSIIQRPASVEEVAHMVVYICSTQASATTGAALRVDGGVVDTIA